MILKTVKNNFLKICALSFCLIQPYFLSARENTDASLYSELTAAYESRAFPGVIEYASRIENNFPRSLYLGQALSAKGEACFKLGRFDEAIAALEKGASLSSKDFSCKVKCSYWGGRTYMEEGEYEKAISCFYKVLSICKTKKSLLNSQELKLADKSYYYAALSYCTLEKYQPSIALLEHVAESGNAYSVNEYQQAMELLFTAYEKTQNYSKAIELYESLLKNESFFDQETFGSITLLAGECYENEGQYKKAYDSYTKVLKSSSPSLASNALLKAYNAASNYKAVIGQEPGVILESAQKSLVEYPNLISEFYLRSAIDSFNEDKYTKSLEYFSKAEENTDRNYKQLIGLYRTEIAILQNPAKISDALALLNKYALDTELSPSDILYENYQEERTRISVLLRDWEKVIDFSKEIVLASQKGKDKNAVSYLYALACYECADYKAVREVLAPYASKTVKVDDMQYYKSEVLYALASAKTGYINSAEKILERLDKAGVLKTEDKLSYAKILLSQGKLSAAYNCASKISSIEAVYVSALACFNKKNWSSAETLFRQCITKASSLDKVYKTYSQFYLGYSQFRNGKTKESYETLKTFVQENSSHELTWNACMIASNCAVQNNKFDDAVAMAENALLVSSNENKKQEVITLMANIYTDAGKYDLAIDTLSSSIRLQSDFGVKARYQTAQIYAKQGMIEMSDIMYGQIVEQFKDNVLAGDASYRRGELYYNASMWDKALERFEEYRNLFPKGEFLDASYFYSAKALAEKQNYDSAILMYLTLINTIKSSSYRYNAQKELVVLYRKTKDFSEALSLARDMLSEYPEQASKDGIASQINQLKALSGGEEEVVVKQRDAYESAGKSATLAGRKAGTELAETLFKSAETKEEAVKLSMELLSIQSAKENIEKEHSFAARTAAVIARYYRTNSKASLAAENYLAAAKYARMGNEHKYAASMLYYAAEAFDSISLDGDALSVIKEMESLYPTDEYTKRAKELSSYKSE